MKNSGKNLTLSLGLALALIFGGTQTVWGSMEEEVVDIEAKPIGLPVVNELPDDPPAPNYCVRFGNWFKTAVKEVAKFATNDGVRGSLMLLSEVVDDFKNDPDLANNAQVQAALTGTSMAIDEFEELLDIIRDVSKKDPKEQKAALIEALTKEEGGYIAGITARIEEIAKKNAPVFKSTLDFLNGLVKIANKVVLAEDEDRKAVILAQTYKLYKVIRGFVDELELQKKTGFAAVGTTNKALARQANRLALMGKTEMQMRDLKRAVKHELFVDNKEELTAAKLLANSILAEEIN